MSLAETIALQSLVVLATGLLTDSFIGLLSLSIEAFSSNLLFFHGLIFLKCMIEMSCSQQKVAFLVCL